jgi:CBS domain-containing protein
MRAADVMSRPPVTVEPSTPVKEAAAIMAERRVSGLPVVDAGGHLVGIVSEADLLRLEVGTEARTQITQLPDHAPRRIHDVMTRDVVTVDEDTDLGVCVQRMLEAGVKRVPVLAEGRVVGVLSRHDLMAVLARPDEEIRADVVVALAAEEGMRGLEVSVRDGVVALVGDADPVALRLAESIARGVPGALAVRVAAQ